MCYNMENKHMFAILAREQYLIIDRMVRNMVLQERLSLEEKLRILSDAAKYDVACTSSGVERAGNGKDLGNAAACGICHSFAADGRCISLLKILYTNECVFDCKYCLNRSSNDIERATFTPEEICTLTMEFYRRNYIEGLFLSSGVLRSPNETMEKIVQTLQLLRVKYRFNGYIHCKAIPGASEDLIEAAGWFADRMSINMELPTAEGLKALAPHKTRRTILTPMRKIQLGIEESRAALGMMGGNEGAYRVTQKRLYESTGGRLGTSKEEGGIPGKPGNEKRSEGTGAHSQRNTRSRTEQTDILREGESAAEEVLLERAGNRMLRPDKLGAARGFAAAGQSTQMIIGATGESDYQILSVAEALYQKFDLKRVFYSAFIRVNDDSALPEIPGGPPLLREHRLYQADWLLRYYGFEAEELLTEQKPNFNVFLDPKCDWALRNLEQFPVEVNRADYFTLLRVPGIGTRSAGRIVRARQNGTLRFEDLKKLGVVLKRAIYFITCAGRMMYPVKIEENYITNQLLGLNDLPKQFKGDSMTYQQLSLFDDAAFGQYNKELLPRQTVI